MLQKQVNREQIMHHTEGTFLAPPGRFLYYQSWLPQQPKATLVIVHGLGGHSGMFMNVVSSLVMQQYALYALDLPGNGRSPGQRGYVKTWADFRDSLRAFLEVVKTQQPGLPLFLLGHSVGAVVVLDYVMRAAGEIPLAGVIVSSPMVGAVPVAPLKIWLGRMFSRLLPRFTLKTGLAREAGTHDPTMLAGYAHDPLRHTWVTARFATEFFATVAWIHAQAQAWPLPLLILQGGNDQVAAPEGGQCLFQEIAFADKEWCIYPGAYHELFDDSDRQKVLEDLGNWLERHLRR